MNLRAIIEKQGLSPFKPAWQKKSPAILKTKDARKVYDKIRNKLCSGFVFPATRNLLDTLHLPASESEIKQRQEFFKNLPEPVEILKHLKQPRSYWRPSYSILAVTEDENTYKDLKTKGVPVTMLLSTHDMENLNEYDIVQAVDCDKFIFQLEQLNNAVIFDNPGEIYLEKYLIQLSAWQHNIELLEDVIDTTELKDMLRFLDTKTTAFSVEEIEQATEKINNQVSELLKDTQVTGDKIVNMLDSGSLPEELHKIVLTQIKNSGYDPVFFKASLPVKPDYEEINLHLRQTQNNIYINFVEKLRYNKEKLGKIPTLIRQIETELLILDFSSILQNPTGKFARIDELKLEDSTNILLSNPEPISFELNKQHRCSILTGANSGGKTTLIEHVIQTIILGQLGLPLTGNVSVPIINEIYYFAKNKGSMNQGAFETLLKQMASIKNAQNAFIFADEIEAITEPGVAADIISASADYFIRKGFYLIFATHLGKELEHNLPAKTRIDGIEATGLDNNLNLIIKRSPVLGRLAHSTPELIIDRLAKKTKDDYFIHIQAKLNK